MMPKERNNSDLGSHDRSDLELLCYMFDTLDAWYTSCYLRHVEMNVFEEKKLKNVIYRKKKKIVIYRKNICSFCLQSITMMEFKL